MFFLVIDDNGSETQLRVTICAVLMKTKEITLYETIYQYLLDLIIENGVTLNKIFFRTDGEHNLYRGFENIF